MGISNTVDGGSGRDRVTSPLPSSSCSLARRVFVRLPGFETFPYFSCRSSAAMSRWRGSCLAFCDGFSERGMRFHRNRIDWANRSGRSGVSSRVVLSLSSALIINIPSLQKGATTGGRNININPFSSLTPISTWPLRPQNPSVLPLLFSLRLLTQYALPAPC